MCEKCTAIDEKVAQYRRLAKYILDQPILDRIEEMIADLLAAKELIFHREK